MGCYVDKHGRPSRSSGYVRWEARANSFATRGQHLLLFSPSFVEIRLIHKGRLEQARPLSQRYHFLFANFFYLILL
jgi:RHO1 GDP-GTP exchange protein 1/2